MKLFCRMLCFVLCVCLLCSLIACQKTPTDNVAKNQSAATQISTEYFTTATAIQSTTQTTQIAVTTTRLPTAVPTAIVGKTTKTTVSKTTATTNAHTAADLYFPIHNAALKVPTAAVMKDISIGFDRAQKRVRMQLPETMTIKVTEQQSRAYAAIYCGTVCIGRLVPNFYFSDTVSKETEDTLEVSGCTIQHFSYTAGNHIAYTYSGFMMLDDAFFCVLEISADYITPEDLAICMQSLQSIQLLERNNRLDCRNQDNLRIAIAGNSFIAYSEVAGQLQQLLKTNQKNATVDGYSYPNISVAQMVADSRIMQTLCGGNYDILFISSAYYSEDVTALSVVEDACNASGTELVLFPAHNEGTFNSELAYRSTTVKLAHWRVVLDRLLDKGVPESDLIYYDGVRHSKPLAGYCGAVMIYGMLYESAPNAASFGASYCQVSEELAQQVESITMDFIRPYFE